MLIVVCLLFQDPAAAADAARETTAAEFIAPAVYVAFLYLLMALLVERMAEILMAVYGYVEHRSPRIRNHWPRQAREICTRLNELTRVGDGKLSGIQTLARAYWRLLAQPRFEGGRHIVSADLIRQRYLRVGNRVLALVLSLAVVFPVICAKGFNLASVLAGFFPESMPFVDRLSSLAANPALGGVIAAALVSLGVEPLHAVITAVEKKSAELRKRK